MKKLSILSCLVILLIFAVSVNSEEINFSNLIHYSYAQNGTWDPNTGIVNIPIVVNPESWHSSLRFIKPVEKDCVYRLYIECDAIKPASGSIQIRENTSAYNAYAQKNIVYNGIAEVFLTPNVSDPGARVVLNMGANPTVVVFKKIKFEKANFINQKELSLNQLSHYTFYDSGDWDSITKTITTLKVGEGWHNSLSLPISIEEGKMLRLQINTTPTASMTGTVLIKKQDNQNYIPYASPVDVNWGKIDVLIVANKTENNALLTLNFGESLGSCQINSINTSVVEGYAAPKIEKVNYLVEAIKNLEAAAGIKRPN